MKITSALLLFWFSLGLVKVGVGQSLTVPLYGEGTQEVVEQYNTIKLEDGEVLPWFLCPEVKIIRQRVFTSVEAKQAYMRFRRNVLKVLPYAIYAQKRYDKLDRDLALVNDKKVEKELIKQCESEIKTMFNREIKNMTISQGEILIKLVDKYTGKTSYDMVKQMKGGMTAFFYQGIAKIFGHNLKTTYDAREDFEIENIIREFQQNRIDSKM